MKRNLIIISLVSCFLIIAMIYISRSDIEPTGKALGTYKGDGLELVSTYKNYPPRIDGTLDFGEWLTASILSFDGGYMAIYNDDRRLYILLNVLDDDTEDIRTASSEGDYFWLTFDSDGDGEISTADLNFQMKAGSDTLRFAHYSGPGTIGAMVTNPIRSTIASGFGCFTADMTEILYVPPLAPVCKKHRLWEVAIDLQEIGINIFDIDPEVDKIRMGVRIVSENPVMDVWTPVDFNFSFDNLISIQLAKPDYAIYGNPGATFSFDESPDALEITQAIQDRSNSLRLVAEKDTVVRVYPLKGESDTNDPAYVYLYGRKSGEELPGSPLCQIHFPRESIDRTRLFDTVNFSLPDAWLKGSVEFQAVMYDFFNVSTASASVIKSFLVQEKPTYWIIPIRIVYDGMNYTGNMSRIDGSISYLKTVYPIKDANCIILDEDEIAPIETEFHPIDEWGHSVLEAMYRLNDYYDSLEHTYSLGLLGAGYDDPSFPDQIIGIIPTGGQSDPVSSGGDGHVATSATVRYPYLAHEINHNMDRRSLDEATWGNHVCNPDDYYDYTWGCKADGCDLDWAAEWNNAVLHGIGFDTRKPWVDGYNELHNWSRFTVQPGIFNEFSYSQGTMWEGVTDFMSYCRSRIRCPDDMLDTTSSCYGFYTVQIVPEQWISPYRWEKLFDEFSQSYPVVVQEVWHIFGDMSNSGHGNFRHAFLQPGIIDTVPQSGEHEIMVLDQFGKMLKKRPFNMSFTISDLKGEPPFDVDSKPFSFTIPPVEGAYSFVLMSNGKEVDRLQKSDNSPQLTIISPQGGEQWDSSGVITWAAEDKDGDELRFIVTYSPDGGNRWHPIAWNITGNSLQVNADLLPGGNDAKIRIIASDGMNTVYAETNGPFTVKNKAPRAHILYLGDGTSYDPGDELEFTGSAFDLEDGNISGQNLQWSYEDEIFASGKNVRVRLPEGVSSVNLTVYDSTGKYSMTSLSLTPASSETARIQ